MSHACAPLLGTAQAPSGAWFMAQAPSCVHPSGIIIVVLIVSILLKSQTGQYALFEDVCLSVAVGDSEVGTSRRPRQGGWGGTGGEVTVGRTALRWWPMLPSYSQHTFTYWAEVQLVFEVCCTSRLRAYIACCGLPLVHKVYCCS